MPGDYTRKTFDRRKHYQGVLMQQGRVQLDADWNEQLAIQLYRTETEAKDVIGPCGVPKTSDAFKITTNGGDLFITPGRIYADGLLCELESEAQATYTHQPHYPNPEFTSPGSPLSSPISSPPSGSRLTPPDGMYLAYLDAWQREITALDDPLIREKALGGPDTATRLQTVWQVRLLRIVTNNGDVTCKTALPEYVQRTAPTTGRLTAQTRQADDPNNPCLLPPKAGYLRLENQLYRAEVHKGGDRNVATFKWSRDNATVETTVEPGKASGSLLTVSDIGKDEVLTFRDGDWVELVTEEATLKAAPFPLVQIDHVEPATREIRLKTAVPAAANVPGLKVRRWDQTGTRATTDGVSMTLTNPIDLEGGIQVSFSGGRYHSGDYWLIPARTVTGEIEWPPFEIPNRDPLALLPIGIKHHYCRLALIHAQGGIVEVTEDCRQRFPSLTEICAEDVCFENDNCRLPGVETVQDALDRLCAARDLRFHNKHLHGWGIVCGLQVECGPDPLGQPRRHVSVRHGYAIDCEGNDVILEKDEQLDLVELSARLASPPGSPLTSPPAGLSDGELALFIELDEQQRRRFRVERYTPKHDFQTLFQGTLLADFFNDCIRRLVDFFKEELTPDPDETGAVGPARKRVTTLLNLIIQLFNPTNGSFVFISREEDRILRELYTGLRALLQSHTFCSMFDSARPFPDRYPFPDQDIVTIFGRGSQQRLRIAPNSRVAYAVGGNTNKIAVYDLRKNEMAAELEFPGGSNALVQDVAFSRDGNQLFAVGTLNNKDTAFAVADVVGLNHVWRRPTVVCDVLLVTLATAPSISPDVYAIGKGKGLYQINPQNINATPQPMFPFNAVGHIVIFDQEGVAYATAAAAGAVSTLYNSVVRVNLRASTSTPSPIPLPPVSGQAVFGQDDIALSFLSGAPARLYVVVNPPSGFTKKQLMIFNAVSGGLQGQRDLGEANTEIRLAFNPATRRMVVSYEESYRLAVLNADDQPEPAFRFPAQISPVSIAASADNRRFYALNFASNTISSIPSELLDPGAQLSMSDLVTYRTAVLNAFFDLAAGLLQYLKDCLCDHFLVNCPTCDSSDKLYLGVISIKNRQVFKVCNFSLRKYVKSFPTVEYWLSLIPILPLVKKAVEGFCCSVLPNFFGKRNAPQAQVRPDEITLADNRIKSTSIRSGAEFIKTADFLSATLEAAGKFRSSGSLIFDAATSATRHEEARAPSVRHSDIAGQPVDEAQLRLRTAKINVVGVQPYNPAGGLANLVEFGRAPLRLEEGAQVKLIVRDNKVLYYEPVGTESPQIKTLREDLEATKTKVAEAAQLRSELSALKREMQDMQKKHQDALTARNKELQSNVQAVQVLQKQVAKLTQEKKATPRPKKTEDKS